MAPPASDPKDSRELVVKLREADEDGSSSTTDSAVYTLRGVADDGEIKSWTEFCASVFAYKANPPPPSYFMRHFRNDPFARAPSLIRIVVHEGAIVASCRVLRRPISLTGGKTITAGGIGEVCTGAHHRRRGLAKELLQDAIQIMQADKEMKVSLLHAAPKFFPVYEKSGYSCTRSRWTEVTIETSTLLQSSIVGSTKVVRHARFPDDTPQFMKLHQAYSEQRFAGCIVRSEEYWNSYISEELQGSLWVLEDENKNEDGRILGWLSIRQRGESFQLREFGCRFVEQVPQTFETLLVHQVAVAEKEMASLQSFKLNMPTQVLEEVQARQELANFVKSTTNNDDLGWMYKALDGKDGSISMPAISLSRPHLIWPSDSF